MYLDDVLVVPCGTPVCTFCLVGMNHESKIVEILGWPARVIVLARTLLMKSCRSHCKLCKQ